MVAIAAVCLGAGAVWFFYKRKMAAEDAFVGGSGKRLTTEEQMRALDDLDMEMGPQKGRRPFPRPRL